MSLIVRDRPPTKRHFFCFCLALFSTFWAGQALKADLIARQFGGRVIMCDTHEPPQRPDVSQVGDGGASQDSEELEDEEERAASLLTNAKKAISPR